MQLCPPQVQLMTAASLSRLHGVGHTAVLVRCRWCCLTALEVPPLLTTLPAATADTGDILQPQGAKIRSVASHSDTCLCCYATVRQLQVCQALPSSRAQLAQSLIAQGVSGQQQLLQDRVGLQHI